jgi:Growth regulator
LDSRIQRWGNSLALRIPKAFAAQAGLEENSSVELELDGDTLVVRPAKKNWVLAKLLSEMTTGNKHRGVEWGGKRGRESW